MAGTTFSFSFPFRTTALLLAAFLVFFFSTTSATCWFPDGVTEDADGYPCNTTASASQCCRTFEACLLGGVCYTQWDSQMYRRSCTDKTFTDPNCPQECKTTGPSGPEGISACTDGTKPTYCCDVAGVSTSCCNSGGFEFIPGGVMGVLDGAGVLNTPSANTVTTASPTSTSTSSTQTTSSSTTTSSSSSSSTTASPTSAPSAAAAAAASSHTGRTVGLAVGISLGVCAIAAVLGMWFFFRRKLGRERRQREGLESRIQAAGAATLAKKPELSTEKLHQTSNVVGTGAAQEMDSSRRQELTGDTAGRTASTPYEVGSGHTYRHEVM